MLAFKIILLISISSCFAKITLNTTDATDKKDDDIYRENVTLPREMNKWLDDESNTDSVANPKLSDTNKSNSDSIIESKKIPLIEQEIELRIPPDIKSAKFSAGVLKFWSENQFWPHQISAEKWASTLAWLKKDFNNYAQWESLIFNINSHLNPKPNPWPFSHQSYNLGPEVRFMNSSWVANPQIENDSQYKIYNELLLFHLENIQTQNPLNTDDLILTLGQFISTENNESYLFKDLNEESMHSKNKLTLLLIPESQRINYQSQNKIIPLFLPRLIDNKEAFNEGYQWASKNYSTLKGTLSQYKISKLDEAPSPAQFSPLEYTQKSRVQKNSWDYLFENLHLYSSNDTQRNSLLDSIKLNQDLKTIVNQWKSNKRVSKLQNASIGVQTDSNNIKLIANSKPISNWIINAGISGSNYTNLLGNFYTEWYSLSRFNTHLYSDNAVNHKIQSYEFGLNIEGLASPYLDLGMNYKIGQADLNDNSNSIDVLEKKWNEFNLSAKYKSSNLLIDHNIEFSQNTYRIEGVLVSAFDTTLFIAKPETATTGIIINGDYGFVNSDSYLDKTFYKALFNLQLRSISLDEFSEKGAPLNSRLGFKISGNQELHQSWFIGLGLNYVQEFSVKNLTDGNLTNPEDFDGSIFKTSDPLLNAIFAPVTYETFKTTYHPSLNNRSFGFHNFTVRLGYDPNSYFSSALSMHWIQTHKTPAEYNSGFLQVLEWRNKLSYKSFLINTYAESASSRGEPLDWTFGINLGHPLTFY